MTKEIVWSNGFIQKFLLFIGGGILTAVSSYVALKGDVKNLARQVETTQERQVADEANIRWNRDAIIEIRSELKYIKAGVDEIRREVKTP